MYNVVHSDSGLRLRGPNPIHGRDEADAGPADAVLKSYLKGEADAVLRNGHRTVDSDSLLSLTLSPVTLIVEIITKAEVRFRIPHTQPPIKRFDIELE